MLLLAIAAVGLCSSFVLYLSGLNHISSSASQVVIQTSPMFVVIGGVLIFKESFQIMQWMGFSVLVIGLAFFFNQRIMDFAGQPASSNCYGSR